MNSKRKDSRDAIINNPIQPGLTLVSCFYQILKETKRSKTPKNQDNTLKKFG